MHQEFVIAFIDGTASKHGCRKIILGLPEALDHRVSQSVPFAHRGSRMKTTGYLACLAGIDADPGATVLLARVSTPDQVEAEARSRVLEFCRRRLADRLRLVDVPTARAVVRRNGPALIFMLRGSDSELAAAGLADRSQASSFPDVYGAPVETLVHAIGLDPACASRD